MTPADNNEAVSRTRINEALWIDPEHRHPITGELGAPHLYFLKTTHDYPHGCTQVVEDIQAQRLEVVGEANGKRLYGEDRDPNVPDHLYDAVRYYMNSHAKKQSALRNSKYNPNTFEGYLKLSERDRKRSRITNSFGGNY